MAVDVDEPEGLEFTGNFEVDFVDGCRKCNYTPFDILRIRYPLPPLPIAITPRPVTAADISPSIPELQVDEGADNPAQGAPQDVSPISMPATPAADVPAPAKVMSYASRYRFSPTIILESLESDDEDDFQRLEVRGWKLPVAIMEVLSGVIPACGSITNLILWSCGLDELHFPLLLNTILSTNIRVLTLDENPNIPEHLFAYLLSEESSIRSLSIRSNNIGDVGAKAISEQLRINRMLSHLNLWNNKITKEGAEALAESLRFNQTLTSLSLACNDIGDDGAIAFSKVLSNAPLLHDELAQRRKAIADLDKQRKEQEEDPVVKKAKGRVTTTTGGRNNSAKVKSEESIANPNKKESVVDNKNKRATKGGKKEELGSAGTGKGGGAAAQPNVNKQKSSTEVVLPVAAVAKKGGVANAVATVAEDKGGATKGKDKKGAVPVKAGKRGKAEETKEEIDEIAEPAPQVEPMFEHNGQWFILGNRTLSNLNLYRNNIHEEGLKALYDAVFEQEATMENAPEGVPGVYRITLQENLFEVDGPVYQQLCNLLNTRNPYAVARDVETAKSVMMESTESEKGETSSDLGL